jgi:signal peptidase I
VAAGETFNPWGERDSAYPSGQRGVGAPGTDVDPYDTRHSGRAVDRAVDSDRAAGPAYGGPGTGFGRRRGFWGRSNQRSKDSHRWPRRLVALIVLVCAAVLVRTFLLQAFYVPSGSMEGTLQVGDRVLVNKIIYNFRSPRRGEVVMFHGSASWLPETDSDTNSGILSSAGRRVGDLFGVSDLGRHNFLRRVIGLPGDTVACCDSNGRIIVNGKGIDEPYVTLNAPVDSPKDTPPCNTRRFSPTVVQPGYVFVLGDDRLVAPDSRCDGQVPMSDVVGRAMAIAWPTGRWSLLSPPKSFSHVPAPYSLGPVVRDRTRIPADPDPTGLVLAIPFMTAFGLPARIVRRRGIRRVGSVRDR